MAKRSQEDGAELANTVFTAVVSLLSASKAPLCACKSTLQAKSCCMFEIPKKDGGGREEEGGEGGWGGATYASHIQKDCLQRTQSTCGKVHAAAKEEIGMFA